MLQLEVCIIGPPSTSFTLHILPLATPSPFSVSYELGFCLFFKIPHISENIYIFLCLTYFI